MTATTTQLVLYNKSLQYLGGRKLASLSEEREARRYLDDCYIDTLLMCLRAGQWNFAMRAIQIDNTGAITPAFGYESAFEKPCDWIRTSCISTSETFDPPLRQYQDQEGYWLANATTLYVRYVSKDIGLNLAAWPIDYAEYVGVALASRIAFRITQKDDLVEKIEAKEQKFFRRAAANDAMDQAPAVWPLGTWTTNRIRRGVLAPYSNSIRNW
jgi:hypothetical protein